ncbi:hypothetical protein BC835DRAFT_1335597 [Cytidiella melzeri]|nr:hypothetical protein BC835DRAFT_1335597 [Cytidiella melzeri]
MPADSECMLGLFRPTAVVATYQIITLKAKEFTPSGVARTMGNSWSATAYRQSTLMPSCRMPEALRLWRGFPRSMTIILAIPMVVTVTSMLYWRFLVLHPARSQVRTSVIQSASHFTAPDCCEVILILGISSRLHVARSSSCCECATQLTQRNEVLQSGSTGGQCA